MAPMSHSARFSLFEAPGSGSGHASGSDSSGFQVARSSSWSSQPLASDPISQTTSASSSASHSLPVSPELVVKRTLSNSTSPQSVSPPDTPPPLCLTTANEKLLAQVRARVLGYRNGVGAADGGHVPSCARAHDTSAETSARTGAKERTRWLITTLGSKQGEETSMAPEKDWLAEALADWIESIIAGKIITWTNDLRLLLAAMAVWTRGRARSRGAPSLTSPLLTPTFARVLAPLRPRRRNHLSKPRHHVFALSPRKLVPCHERALRRIESPPAAVPPPVL